MKRVKKGQEPYRLDNYRAQFPQESWDNFRDEQPSYKAVVEQLRRDQNGLCAYCEIDLKLGGDRGKNDLRVEHFHPKSISDCGFNWHLDWSNLLACCHGGSERYVVDNDTRFSAPELSCDAFKEQRVLDGMILNPLKIPAFPRFFDCDRGTGMLKVSGLIHEQEVYSEAQVDNTIRELNLNAERLKRHRKVVLDKLNNEARELLEKVSSIDEALEILAKSILVPNKDDEWPAFFTSIRSYLGLVAETHLRRLSFNG